MYVYVSLLCSKVSTDNCSDVADLACRSFAIAELPRHTKGGEEGRVTIILYVIRSLLQCAVSAN